MKVVINSCYGGFSLSPKAEAAYLARQGKEAFFYINSRKNDRIDFDSYERADLSQDNFVTYTLTKDLGDNPTEEQMDEEDKIWFNDREIPRDDPDLIAVVEELGDEAAGSHAKLKIVEIPDGTDFVIEEYDGLEHVAQSHAVWY